NSRDLIILLTDDYLRSPYTRKEFTSFEAERVKTAEERHIIVLRCEDVPLRGLLPTMFIKRWAALRTLKNASAAASLVLTANRRQRHRHRDHASVCRHVLRASQAAQTNLIGSTPF